MVTSSSKEKYTSVFQSKLNFSPLICGVCHLFWDLNCKDPHHRQSHCLRHARVWSLSACLIKGFCHISQSHLWGLAQSIPESKGKISLRCTGLLNIHSHFKCCPSVKSKWHWCLYQTPSSNFQKLFGWLRCSHSGRNSSFVRNGLPWPSLAYEGLGECILRGLPQSISGW